MEFFLEFVNTIVYFMCVRYIGELFLVYKPRVVRFKNSILIFIALLTAGIMLYSNIGIKTIGHIVSTCIVSCLFFQVNWRKILGLYVGSMAVVSILSMISGIVSTELIRIFKLEDSYNIARIVNISIILLCILVIGKYYKNKYEQALRSIQTKYWLFFLIIMLFDSIVMVAIGDAILLAVQVERKYIAIISYWCVVIGLLIQLVLLINTLVTRNVHKENEKLAKQFLENQNEHYQYLEKREYETKKFRHDIKNHLILLENFINTKKYDEAKEYLDTINEKVTSFSNQISVNNGIADAILNRFYTEAQEKGITLKVSGHFPMDCYITAYDICTILSNLLSNAIRAELEAEKEDVLVHIKYIDNKVMLTVENDYIHELNQVDGVFKTTKQDSLGHGYGLSNVKECVEKNGGYLSISTENCRFKVMVMMLNEKEEQL